VKRIFVIAVTIAIAAACGPTCGGSATSPSSSHPSSGSANGTFPVDITITGFFGGHFTSAFASCTKTTEAFQGYVQDTKPGSALRFDFNIRASVYHGPGTYGPGDGSIAILGSVYMAGQETWSAKSGTFTVNAGEKSGTIQMHLESGPGQPGEDISGTWRCG